MNTFETTVTSDCDAKGHVLGFGTIWEDKGLLAGAGTSDPTYTGAQGLLAYNQIFGTNVRGVPVENIGGPGTADSHWRETVFTNELMTGFAGPGTSLPISKVTVGQFADLGYTVNFAAADPFVPSAIRAAVSSRATAGSSVSLRASSDLIAIASTEAATDATSDAIVHNSVQNSSNLRHDCQTMTASLVDAALSDIRNSALAFRSAVAGPRSSADSAFDFAALASDFQAAALDTVFSGVA